MRVLLGLAALAAGVSADPTVTLKSGDAQQGTAALAPPTGTTALAALSVQEGTATLGAQGSYQTFTYVKTPTVSMGALGNMVQGQIYNTINGVVYAAYTSTHLQMTFTTNQYTGQMQYRWYPGYGADFATQYPGNGFSAQSYTCDPCAGGTPISCYTATGPGGTVMQPQLVTPKTGFPCSSFTRNYLFGPLTQSTWQADLPNSFSVQLFDIQDKPAPNVSSYSFTVYRAKNPILIGDPQIVGMQGQDFQVHGVPDEIFNMVSSPSLQVNARFAYLQTAECFDNYTACFAHPGTYVTEEGIRVGADKVRVTAGSFKKGLTVSVNGKKTTANVDLKQGAVEIVNHRRVVVHTNIMKITVTNSDKFLNQELELQDDKLLTLGSKRRILKDNDRFHPEVPLHGLQGQTWRNVEYPSGLDYEGSIMDYHVVDGNLFGTDFVFNQFKA